MKSFWTLTNQLKCLWTLVSSSAKWHRHTLLHRMDVKIKGEPAWSIVFCTEWEEPGSLQPTTISRAQSSLLPSVTGPGNSSQGMRGARIPWLCLQWAPSMKYRAKYRTEMYRCAVEKGQGKYTVGDHRGEQLSPLAEDVNEVFTGKVTFAEKHNYYESSLKVMTWWSVYIGAGLVQCQEQNGRLINICWMNDLTSRILLLLVIQLL